MFTITTELPVPGTVPVPPVECGGMLELQSPNILTDWNILWRVRLYFCSYLLPNYVNSRWRKNFRKTFYHIFISSYFPVDHLMTRLWVPSSWDKENFTSRTKKGTNINGLSDDHFYFIQKVWQLLSNLKLLLVLLLGTWI